MITAIATYEVFCISYGPRTNQTIAMHKVELSYLLSAQRGKDALIRNPLMDMLHAVREQGSITKAAKALD